MERVSLEAFPIAFSRKQGCLYVRIPGQRWFVVHWWTKAVR
jgi:hypothetical protein